MVIRAEIEEAAKAMVLLGQERRAAGRDMPSRYEEAAAALAAAERVRNGLPPLYVYDPVTGKATLAADGNAVPNGERS